LGFKDIPICGLSANVMSDDVEKGLSIGMSDYLPKPIEFLEVEVVLRKYLREQASGLES
jgi:CheY-like chemotaxis protein